MKLQKISEKRSELMDIWYQCINPSLFPPEERIKRSSSTFTRPSPCREIRVESGSPAESRSVSYAQKWLRHLLKTSAEQVIYNRLRFTARREAATGSERETNVDGVWRRPDFVYHQQIYGETTWNGFVVHTDVMRRECAPINKVSDWKHVRLHSQKDWSMRVKGRQRQLSVTSSLRCDAAGEKKHVFFQTSREKNGKKKKHN